jgi:hypothetical protein
LGAIANPDLQVVARVGPPVSDGTDTRSLPEEVGHFICAGIAARLIR